jgi:endo-1,4-beta-D-glucanase Y
MKQRHLRSDSTAGLRSLLLLGTATMAASFACDSGTGSSDPEPMKSTGGAPSTGGASTGGTTTGGVTTSGGASGSSPTGGAAAGGAATGGAATGGAGVGGAVPGGSGGASGSAGAGGSGGGSGSCKGGVPTPSTATAKFPFPQHRFSDACIYPTACDAMDASVGWQKYKEKLVVDGGDGTLRVRRPENMDDTVSEGMAYGMLFAVYMNDREAFDKLWAYTQSKFDDKGLMHWQIRADGSIQGGNSATDSDEDIGFALVMADKQWGGFGEVAKSYLGKVLAHDFQSDGTIKGGDNYNDVNPSYLAPAFYRTFAKYTGENRWNQIIDKSYEILDGAANDTTGLVPDWTNGRGNDYKYDAARTPYRIGIDACWNKEPRAKAYAEKVSAFFAMVGVENIRDGYALDGTKLSDNKNSTFIGPAGVAGMAANQTLLVNDTYTQVSTDLQAGTESYYNLSWAMFTGLMMTGNFVDFGSL